jgi:Sulfatase
MKAADPRPAAARMTATVTAARAFAARHGAAVRVALRDYAHLAALSSFALAQPLFELLRDSPEFLAARGALGFDVVSFAVGLVALPPALLLAIELLGGLLGRVVRRALHLAFVAALVALTAAPPLERSIDASDAVLIALAAAVGLAAAAAYARAAAVRSFTTVLAPAPLAFLALFLLLPPISGLAFPSHVGARSVGGVVRAPVVVVLFDELPLTSLLDDRGRVDPVRYPAFARLERTARWFRNAYAVYDSTEHAQPAIMDGNYPTAGELPTASDHPNSLFTLLGRTHRMNVSEEATAVCPGSLCEDPRLEVPYGERMRSMAADLGLVWLHTVSPRGVEARLPSVSDTWGSFTGEASAPTSGAVRANLNANRAGRFDAWIRRITPGRLPQLSLKHTLLPHVPWQYLPDGRQYRGAADPIAGLSRQSFRDATQVESLYQRHLLQLGFADRELGRLLRHLDRAGLFEPSLIIVTADHGVAFDTGRFDRRRLTRSNADQIAAVPLFIKAPGQRTGVVDDAYAETVDIVPTIFDLLDVQPRVRMDGSSAFGPKVRRRRTVRVLERGTFRPLRFSAGDWERAQAAALRRKLRLFGVGRDGPLRLFRIGPRRNLLSRPVRDFPVEDAAGARFVHAGRYDRVSLRSPTLPAWATGRLDGVPAGRDLAVAVNGRIAGLTASFRLATGGDTLFAVMVPASSFRPGQNRVELFEVRGAAAGTGITLRRLGAA